MSGPAEMTQRLTRAFFTRPCSEVAPQLLGCRLVHDLEDGTRLSGTIVEVEAYLGDGSDPGSHAHNGPTRRNASMFGWPGHFYIYRSMGIHVCANFVCEERGSGAAVLLRALEPGEGVAAMRRHRKGRTELELTNGPAKLTQAFAIGIEHDGASALRGPLRVEADEMPARGIACSPRIGLVKGADLWYRYFVRDSPWVTPSPLNRRARENRPIIGAP